MTRGEERVPLTRAEFLGHLEKDIERRDFRHVLPWMTILLGVLLFLRDMAPAWEAIGQLGQEALLAAVILGALLYIPFTDILHAVFEASAPPHLSRDSALRKHVASRLQRRNSGFHLFRIGDALPGVVMTLVTAGILGLAITQGAAQLWPLLLVGALYASRRMAHRHTQPKWVRARWKRLCRKAEDGGALGVQVLSTVFLVALALSQIPWDPARLPGVAYISGAILLVLLSAHLLAWIYRDRSRKLLGQLRFKVAFEGMDLEDAKNCYVGIDVLRTEGVTAFEDIADLEKALSKPPGAGKEREEVRVEVA